MTIKSKNSSKSSLQHYQLWINGHWTRSKSENFFPSINPATEKIIAQISHANSEDVHLAVRSSRKAFESGFWPKMRAKERARILRKIASRIRDKAEELSVLETADCGKPIKNSRNIDIPAAANAFDYYAGWADKLAGETLPLSPEYLSMTLREPLGVIGAITPWNFPLEIASQKIAAALSVGNTLVLKPAEQTSLTALHLAQITTEAGLPDGVLNVVTGFGPTTGADLVAHPEVDGITFTGEHRTGQEIMRNAAGTLKKISFELGGKSANIIFADADLRSAAQFACDGIFFNQGEVCCAGSRLFVDKKIGDSFMDQLLKESKSWQPGDPMHEKTEMGAIVTKEQFEKILSYIEIGQKEGAKLILDGRKKQGQGYFIGPTVFDQVKNPMRLAQEEIFGPVLSKITFVDFEEVIRQANHTFYGLAAAVWTKDISKALKAARALKVGTVWINTYGDFDHAMPFGGYKMSGNSREGGIHTFDFYTQIKSVWVGLN